MQDRTQTAVKRQLCAMHCATYEVGLQQKEKGMLLREWSDDEVLKSIPWLKRQNVQGNNIYIRPARSSASSLVLVDDVSAEMVRGLAAQGLAPTLVTETSPKNYQAWFRLSPESQPPAVRTHVAKQLMQRLGGDPNSADWAHFGRLAGFTNQKPERTLADGRHPFVLLRKADSGAVARLGPEMVGNALAALAAQHQSAIRAEVKAAAEKLQEPAKARVQRELDVGQWYTRLFESLRDRFSADFDASKADWMAAVALASKGYDVDSVASAITKHSPEAAARKGRDLQDYATDTARKAEVWIELRNSGAAYADVKDQLLGLARQRHAERAAQTDPQQSSAQGRG